MEVRETICANPIFSICIPQYNRTSFLIEACKVLAEQTFKDFEVCISDDRSTDGKEQDLIDYLKQSELSFVYKKQPKNLRYDGNIREAISLASGQYCFLHGNDDCLASSSTLENLYAQIQSYDEPAVVICNFEDWETSEKHNRIRKTQLVGSGPEVAVTHFRNVAFVTGVLIDRAQAHDHITEKWDGSEMYQMYIIARTIASGGTLLELRESYVRKDIRIPAESVDSYVKPKLNPCPIVERLLPMRHIGPLIADAVKPYLCDQNKNKIIELIFLQLYYFTYPFWIVEYRRVQSWRYAVGICLGLQPKHTFLKTDLGPTRKLKLFCLYLTVCILGLCLPLNLYQRLKDRLYRLSKTLFTRAKSIPAHSFNS